MRGRNEKSKTGRNTWTAARPRASKHGMTLETKTLDKDEMIAWLEDVGASDIVKDAISLGKGGFDEALSEFLLEHDYDYKYEAKVEGASLKKVISDIIEEREKGADTPLPPETAVHIDQFTVAKITMPKKDKEM